MGKKDIYQHIGSHGQASRAKSLNSADTMHGLLCSAPKINVMPLKTPLLNDFLLHQVTLLLKCVTMLHFMNFWFIVYGTPQCNA